MYWTKPLGLGQHLWVLGQILGFGHNQNQNIQTKGGGGIEILKICIYSWEVSQKLLVKRSKSCNSFFLQHTKITQNLHAKKANQPNYWVTRSPKKINLKKNY